MEKKTYSPEQTSELLKKASSKLIQNFLLDRIKEEVDLCQALGEYLDKPSTKKSGAKDLENTVIKAWKRALDEAQDKWRYYDFWEFDLIEKLQRLLKRVRKEAQNTQQRIFLQLKLLDNVKLRNSYKWEIFGKILEDVIQDFTKIVDTSEEAEGNLLIRKYLFTTCLNYMRKFKVLSDELNYRRKLESFVLETFEREFPDQIKDYINLRVQSIPSSEEDDDDKDDNSWKREYHKGGYVEKMLNLLSINKASENELLSYAKDYWEMEDIRLWFIGHYKNTSQWDKAIEVLEESIVKDKGPKRVSNYKLELKDLYLQTGDTEKYRVILLEEIKGLEGTVEIDMEMYRELKSLYTPEEWMKVREHIFASKVTDPEILVQYFLEDNLHQRLLKLLMAEETSYPFFDKYASSLPQEYSQQLLTKYERHFEHLMLKAKDKIRYKELMNTLKDAHKIAGGKELTQRLTTQWLKKYETRPSLCEEIRNFQSECKSMN